MRRSAALPSPAPADARTRGGVAPRSRPATGRGAWALDVYASAVGKKYVMAVTGVLLMGYVFAHMVGNLKLYLGAAALNEYGEWLRELGEPAAPRTVVLWTLRLGLTLAFALHVHASWALTRMNLRARPVAYQSKRDYVAAGFAARTMRWTGVIVLLFVLFHLADLTWGTLNPGFERGDVYRNVVASFQRAPVALLYVAANLALGVHLYHGAWSLFQSLGIDHPRVPRRCFAVAFTAAVVGGNVSFPLAVQLGLVR